MLKVPTGNYGYAPYLFLTPFFIIFLVFNLYPYATSLFTSFFIWNPVTEFKLENMKFVGAENYFFVLEEPDLNQVLLSISIFLPTSLICIHGFALLMAKLISLTPSFLQQIFVFLIMIPYMVSELVLTHSLLPYFSSPESIANQVLNLLKILPFIGLQDIEVWINVFSYGRTPTVLAYVFLILVMMFKYTGFFTLVYYLTLKSRSVDVLEAARLDGANHLQTFWHIDLPHLSKMLKMMLLLSSIFLLQSSEVQNFLAQLVPYSGQKYFVTFSRIVQTLVYYLDMGSASAFAWLFTFCLFCLLGLLFLFPKILSKIKSPLLRLIKNKEGTVEGMA